MRASKACGLVWSGLVWSGLVWSGLIWSGLIWSDLVWSGLIWYGGVGPIKWRIMARRLALIESRV